MTKDKNKSKTEERGTEIAHEGCEKGWGGGEEGLGGGSRTRVSIIVVLRFVSASGI